MKAAVTIALLWVIADAVDVGEALDRISGLSPLSLVAVLVILAAQLSFQAMRWRILLRLADRPLARRRVVRMNFEGAFFNQALPSVVGGDAMRIYRSTQYGVPVGAAVRSVLLDRGYGSIGLLLLAALTLPVYFAAVDNQAARIGLPVVIACGFGGFALLLAIDFLPRRLTDFRAFRHFRDFAAEARRVLMRPATACAVLGISAGAHVMTASSLMLIAGGMSIEVDFLVWLSVIPAAMLITMLPITIAGWGLREGVLVVALGFLGVAEADALAISVAFGLCLAAVGLPGGLLWLSARSARAGADREQAA